MMDTLENLIIGSDVHLSASDNDIDNGYPPLMVTTTTASQPQAEAAIPPGGFTHFLQTSPPLDAVAAAAAASASNGDDTTRQTTVSTPHRVQNQGKTAVTNATYATTHIDVNTQFAQQQNVAQAQLNQNQNVVLMPGVPVHVCKPGEVLDDNQLKEIMEKSTLAFGPGKLYKVDEKYCFVPDQPTALTGTPGSSIQMFPTTTTDQQLQQAQFQTFPAQHCAHGATYHILPQAATQSQTTAQQSQCLQHGQDQSNRHQHHHHQHQVTQQQHVTRTQKPLAVQQNASNTTSTSVTSSVQQSTVLQSSTQQPQTVQIQMHPQASTGSVGQPQVLIPQILNQNGQMILQLPPNMTQNGMIAPVNFISCQTPMVAGNGSNNATNAAAKPVRQTIKPAATSASSKKPKKILPKPSIANRPLTAIAPAPSHTTLQPGPVAAQTYAQIKPSADQNQAAGITTVQAGGATLTQVTTTVPAACNVKGGRKVTNQRGNRPRNRGGMPVGQTTVLSVPQPAVAIPVSSASNITATGQTGTITVPTSTHMVQSVCCQHQAQHQQQSSQPQTRFQQHQCQSVAHQHHVHHHVHPHGMATVQSTSQSQQQQCVCSPTVYPLNAAVPVDQVQWQAASSHQHCVVSNNTVLHQHVHCPHHHVHQNQHIHPHHNTAQVVTTAQLQQSDLQSQTVQSTQLQQTPTQSQDQEQPADALGSVEKEGQDASDDQKSTQERDVWYEAVLAAFGESGVPEVILDGNADELLQNTEEQIEAAVENSENFFVDATNESTVNQITCENESILPTDTAQETVAPTSMSITQVSSDHDFNLEIQAQSNQEASSEVQGHDSQSTSKEDSQQNTMEFNPVDPDLMDVMSVAATIDGGNKTNDEDNANDVDDSLTANEIGLLLDDTQPTEIHESSTDICQVLDNTTVQQSSPLVKSPGQPVVATNEATKTTSSPLISETERHGGIPKKSPSKRRTARSRQAREAQDNANELGTGNSNAFECESTTRSTGSSKRAVSNDFDFLAAISSDFPQNKTTDHTSGLDNDAFAAVFGAEPADDKVMEDVTELLLEESSNVQSQPTDYDAFAEASKSEGEANKNQELNEHKEPVDETNKMVSDLFTESEPTELQTSSLEVRKAFDSEENNLEKLVDESDIPSTVDESQVPHEEAVAEREASLLIDNEKATAIDELKPTNSVFGDDSTLLEQSIHCDDNNDASTESLETSTGGDSSNRNVSDAIDNFVTQNEFAIPCEKVRALIEDTTDIEEKPSEESKSLSSPITRLHSSPIRNVAEEEEEEEELEPPELQCDGAFTGPEDTDCTQARSPQMNMMSLIQLENMIQSAKVSIGLSMSTDESTSRSNLENSDLSGVIESESAELEKDHQSDKAENSFEENVQTYPETDDSLQRQSSDQLIGSKEENGESSKLEELETSSLIDENAQPPALSPNQLIVDQTTTVLRTGLAKGNFHLYSRRSGDQYSFAKWCLSPVNDSTPSSINDDSSSNDSFVTSLKRVPSNFEAETWHDHQGLAVSVSQTGALVQRAEKHLDTLLVNSTSHVRTIYHYQKTDTAPPASDDDLEQESPVLINETERCQEHQISGDPRLSPPNLEHRDQWPGDGAVVEAIPPEEPIDDSKASGLDECPIEDSVLDKAEVLEVETVPTRSTARQTKEKRGRGRKKRKNTTSRNKVSTQIEMPPEEHHESPVVNDLELMASPSNSVEPLLSTPVELPVCIKGNEDPPEVEVIPSPLIKESEEDRLIPVIENPSESQLEIVDVQQPLFNDETPSCGYEMALPIKEMLPTKISKKSKSRKRRGSSSRTSIDRVKRTRMTRLSEAGSALPTPELTSIEDEPRLSDSVNPGDHGTSEMSTDGTPDDRLPIQSYQLPEKGEPIRSKRSRKASTSQQASNLDSVEDNSADEFRRFEAAKAQVDSSNGRLLLKINFKGMPVVQPLANIVSERDSIEAEVSNEKATSELLPTLRDQEQLDRKVSPIRLSRIGGTRGDTPLGSGDNPDVPIFHVVGRQAPAPNFGVSEATVDDSDDLDDVMTNPRMDVLSPIAEAMQTIYGTSERSLYAQPDHQLSPVYMGNESETPSSALQSSGNNMRHPLKTTTTSSQVDNDDTPPGISSRTSLPRAAKTTCKSNLSLESYLSAATVPHPSRHIPMSDTAADVVLNHRKEDNLVARTSSTEDQEDSVVSEEAYVPAKRNARSKLELGLPSAEVEKNEEPSEPSPVTPVRQRRFFKSAKEDRRSSKRNSSYLASQLFFKHALNNHHGKNSANASGNSGGTGGSTNGPGRPKLSAKSEAASGDPKIKRKRGRPSKKSLAMKNATESPHNQLQAPIVGQAQSPKLGAMVDGYQQESQMYHTSPTRLSNSITSPAASGLMSALSPDGIVGNRVTPCPDDSDNPPISNRTVLVLKRTGNEYSIKAREEEEDEDDEEGDEAKLESYMSEQQTNERTMLLTADECEPMPADVYGSEVMKTKTNAYKKSKEDKKRERKERKKNRKLKRQQKKLNHNKCEENTDNQLVESNTDLGTALSADGGASENSSVGSGTVNHTAAPVPDEEDCLFPAEEVTKLRQNFGSHPTSVSLGHHSTGGSSCASHSSHAGASAGEENGRHAESSLYLGHTSSPSVDALPGEGLDDVGPPLLTPANLPAGSSAGGVVDNGVAGGGASAVESQAVGGCGGAWVADDNSAASKPCGGSSETSSSPGNSFSETVPNGSGASSRPSSGHQQHPASGPADPTGNSGSNHQESSSPPKKRRYVTGGESNTSLLPPSNESFLGGRRSTPPPPPPPPAYKETPNGVDVDVDRHTATAHQAKSSGRCGSRSGQQQRGVSSGSSSSSSSSSSNSAAVQSPITSMNTQHQQPPPPSSSASTRVTSHSNSFAHTSNRTGVSSSNSVNCAHPNSGDSSASAAAVVNSHYYPLPYPESQPYNFFDSSYFAYSAFMNQTLNAHLTGYNAYDLLPHARPPSSGHSFHHPSRTHHPHPTPPAGFPAAASRPAHETGLYQEPPAAHSGSNGVNPSTASVSTNLYGPHTGAPGQVGHGTYHHMFSSQAATASGSNRFRQFGHPGGNGGGGANGQFGTPGGSATGHFTF